MPDPGRGPLLNRPHRLPKSLRGVPKRLRTHWKSGAGLRIERHPQVKRHPKNIQKASHPQDLQETDRLLVGVQERRDFKTFEARSGYVIPVQIFSFTRVVPQDMTKTSSFPGPLGFALGLPSDHDCDLCHARRTAHRPSVRTTRFARPGGRMCRRRASHLQEVRDLEMYRAKR